MNQRTGDAINELRIVAISGLFRPLTGGTEGQAATLARAWAARGCSVEIWTRRLSPEHPRLEPEGGAVLRRLGWTIAAPGAFMSRIEKLTFSMSLAARLIRRRRDYDLVIAFQALYPALIASCARLFTGRPLVLRNASTGSTSDLQAWGPATGAVLSLFRRSADAVVVTNQEGAREAVGCGFSEAKIHRIPNGVMTEEAPGSRPVGRRTRFIYLGGLRPEKRVDLLLRAWAAANSPGELVLAGEGPFRSSLEALAHSLGIAPIFLGNVTDVRSLLADSDVFVLPSDAEGMSNALLEAMASGCACIATHVGGNVDCLAPESTAPPGAGAIFKGSAGWLVPCGDVSAMAEGLRWLAGDRQIRDQLGRQARARVMAEYQVSETAAVYLRLFKGLVAGELPLKRL